MTLQHTIKAVIRPGDTVILAQAEIQTVAVVTLEAEQIREVKEGGGGEGKGGWETQNLK